MTETPGEALGQLVAQSFENLRSFFEASWSTLPSPGLVLLLVPAGLLWIAAVKVLLSESYRAGFVLAVAAGSVTLAAFGEWRLALVVAGVVAAYGVILTLAARPWRSDDDGAAEAASAPAPVPTPVRALRGWTVGEALASMPRLRRGRWSLWHFGVVTVLLALVGGASTGVFLLFGVLPAAIVAGVVALAPFPFVRTAWRRLPRRGGDDAGELLMAHSLAVQYADAVARARSIDDPVVEALWLVQFDAHLSGHPELDRGVWRAEFARLRKAGYLDGAPAAAA